MARPHPVAASSAVELALVGPIRRVTVVASTPLAFYATVDDAERSIICVTTADAVRVPCAVVLDARALPIMPAAGTVGTVGGGALTIDRVAFRVSRWWRPPRPRGLGAAPPGRLASSVRWLTGRVADPLDEPGRAAVADLLQALALGDRPHDAVARLLGRGPGLTPLGDDVLAGALVCLCALGAPARIPLAAAVTSAAPDATTAVSTALLRHAARGECIPQLAALLAAVGTGAPTRLPAPAAGHTTAPPGALPRAAGALLAVGGYSGAGLLHGVLVALAIAHRHLAGGMAHTPVIAA